MDSLWGGVPASQFSEFYDIYRHNLIYWGNLKLTEAEKREVTLQFTRHRLEHLRCCVNRWLTGIPGTAFESYCTPTPKLTVRLSGRQRYSKVVIEAVGQHEHVADQPYPSRSRNYLDDNL